MFKATLSVTIFALCMNKIDHQFLVNIVFDVNRKKIILFLTAKKTHITRPGIILRTLELVERQDRIQLWQLRPASIRNKLCAG